MLMQPRVSQIISIQAQNTYMASWKPMSITQFAFCCPPIQDLTQKFVSRLVEAWCVRNYKEELTNVHRHQQEDTPGNGAR